MEKFIPMGKKLRVAHYPKPMDTPFRMEVPNEYVAKAYIDYLAQHMDFLYNHNIINGYMDHFEVEIYDESTDSWDVYYNDHHDMEFDDIFNEENSMDLTPPKIDFTYMFLYPHITLQNKDDESKKETLG